MRQLIFWPTLLYFLFILPQGVQARTFANLYVEFQLPERWECWLANRMESEWHCSGNPNTEPAPLVVTRVFRRATGSGSVENDLAQLSKARNLAAKAIKIERDKIIDVNGKPWVDTIYVDPDTKLKVRRFLTIEQGQEIAVTFKMSQQEFEGVKEALDQLPHNVRAFKKPGDDLPDYEYHFSQNNTPEPYQFLRSREKIGLFLGFLILAALFFGYRARAGRHRGWKFFIAGIVAFIPAYYLSSIHRSGFTELDVRAVWAFLLFSFSLGLVCIGLAIDFAHESYMNISARVFSILCNLFLAFLSYSCAWGAYGMFFRRAAEL